MGNKKSGIEGWLILSVLIIMAIAIGSGYMHTASFAPAITPSPSTTPPAIAPPGYNYGLIPHTTSHAISGLFSFSVVNSTVPANVVYLGNTITTTLQLNIPANLRTTTWASGITKMVDTSCGSYIWSNSTSTYVYESGIYNGTGSVYSQTLSYKPTSVGIYIFGEACVTTNTTFSNGAWTAWTTPNITLSTYQAYKVPQLYTVTLSNNGCSAVTGAGSYIAGNTTSIEATVPSGYSLSWEGSGSGSYTGSSNPATVAVNGNIAETAICSAPPPPPPPSTNIFSQIANLINGFVQSILKALGL